MTSVGTGSPGWVGQRAEATEPWTLAAWADAPDPAFLPRDVENDKMALSGVFGGYLYLNLSLGRLAGAGVTLETDLYPLLGNVLVDPARLEQVLVTRDRSNCTSSCSARLQPWTTQPTIWLSTPTGFAARPLAYELWSVTMTSLASTYV